jgi:hypothetical protein
MLDSWVRDAQKLVGTRGDRIGWILASTIVTASLQRALDDETPLFLLKGGMLIERALNLKSRTTKDVDTLFLGAVEELEDRIDAALAEPWGELTLTRTEIELIENARRMVKPRRFKVQIAIRGIPWRTIKVEVAFPEGGVADEADRLPALSTSFFGIEEPAELATISMAYQVAQKLHACTDPDDPPAFINDRVRDIADLLLVRDAFYPNGSDLSAVRAACEDIFAARAVEAAELGLQPRSWPPALVANEVWEKNWGIPAGQAEIDATLADAIAAVGRWIEAIRSA